jgi:predicted nicotinamide N-methyase|uniref:Methyltransferase domain-containing protein n=1 Tax=Prymnesium polylepis TaxID=72548 RepID=A0A7S4MNH3_9EUKA|mmetsp:Transcript_32731/g.81360  ORF Transcript_32731/g.81360 Transcript_32731/m.81360 type:complete len:240 (+) Transcript_32731:284-1003(+)
MRLPASLSPPGEPLTLRRVDVSFQPALAAPISVFEAASPDEILERALTSEEDAYSARIWPSSYAASSALLECLAAEPGSSVFELGCGPGMPSLVALAAGAGSVTATDWSPLALALTTHAAVSFQPSRAERLETLRLDIFDETSDVDAEWLVAADMLYDSSLAEAVGRRVAMHLDRGGRAVLADPGRPGGRDALLRGMRSKNTARATRAARAGFVEHALPRRWRPSRSAKVSVGICVLEP